MIEKLKELAKLNIPNDKNKYELINNILNDKNCFKKMNIKTAYSILSDLGFKDDELNRVYNEIVLEKI